VLSCLLLSDLRFCFVLVVSLFSAWLVLELIFQSKDSLLSLPFITGYLSTHDRAQKRNVITGYLVLSCLVLVLSCVLFYCLALCCVVLSCLALLCRVLPFFALVLALVFALILVLPLALVLV
jgi:hypothetical protein